MTEKRNFATVLYKYMVMSLTIIYILHSVNASSVMGNITIYIKAEPEKLLTEDTKYEIIGSIAGGEVSNAIMLLGEGCKKRQRKVMVER